MKLEFTLLIVDDAPDSIEQALNVLDDHLEDKGFTFETTFPRYTFRTKSAKSGEIAW